MPRVLELINESGLGGGQTHVLDLSRGLSARGRWVPEIGAAGGGPLEEAARDAGIPFHPLPFDESGAFGLLQVLRERIRAGNYDLVHTHGGIAGFWGRLAAVGTGVKLVHTLHGIHYLHYDSKPKKLAYRFIDRALAGLTDRIICVCQSDLEHALDAGIVPPRRTRAVLNGIDVDQVERTFARVATTRPSLRAALNIGPDEIALVTVARYHKQKGLPYLLAAFNLALQKIPNLKLILAGSGPEQAALESQSRALSIQSRVHFWTDAGPAVKGGAYAVADLFILPSLWEGLPLVVLEAWACNLPLIATAVDGTREIVRPGRDGLLVPPGDPEAMALAIVDLARDPLRAKALADEGGRRVRADFTLSRMVTETETVYDEL